MSVHARLALIATALILLATSGPAGAQDAFKPSFREAVKELLEIQEAPKLVSEQMTFGMAQQLLQNMAASGIEVTEPIQKIVFDASLNEFGKKFADVDYLTDLYVPVYAKHFEEKELREMSAYWKSPVGQKTLKLMPTLTQETTTVLQESSIELIPSFEKTVMTRFEAEGIATPSAPAP